MTKLSISPFTLSVFIAILIVLSACAPAQQVIVVTATPVPQYNGDESWPTYADPALRGIVYQNAASAAFEVVTQTAIAYQATTAALAESQARAIALYAEATRIAAETDMTATQWALDSIAAQAKLTQQSYEAVAHGTQVASAAGQSAATAQAAVLQSTQMAVDTNKAEAQAHAEIAATQRADEREALDLESERAVQPFRTFAPWFFFLTAFAILIFGSIFAFTRFMRVWELRNSIIPRDERGDAPVLVLPRARGGLVIADPDRFFGPAMQISSADSAELVQAPELVPADFQDRTTARDQAVDLHTRTGQSPVKPNKPDMADFIPAYTPPPSPPAAAHPEPGESTVEPIPLPVIRILPADQVSTWLDEVQEQLALASVEDAHYG